MTCHEKLMHFFFLLTQEVTTADVTHLALFLGTGVHFPWEDFVGLSLRALKKNPPTVCICKLMTNQGRFNWYSSYVSEGFGGEGEIFLKQKSGFILKAEFICLLWSITVKHFP